MDSKNSHQDKYGAIVQLVMHAENISWNRFNNFLVAATVFVIAWATIYSTGPDSCPARFIQAFICLLGFLGGIAWAFLGWRSRDYLDMYFELGKKVEREDDESEIKLFQRPTDIQATHFRYSSSRFLLTVVPIVFAALYLAMFVVTWLKSGARCCF